MRKPVLALAELAADRNMHWSKRTLALLISSLSVALVGFQLFTGWFSPIDPYAQNIFVVVALCALTFLLFPLGRKWNDKPGWSFAIDGAIILGLAAYFVYVFSDFSGYQSRWPSPTLIDWIFGSFMIVVVLEMGRRTLGIILPVISVIVILMNMFAPYMPGPFYGTPIKWTRIVEITAMQDFGIYGSITGVLASYLVLFFFFSEFLQQCGGSKIFLNLALALAGRFAGGPAKASVVGSALFGTMTGAPVANVVAVGSVTIPLMKRMGYKPEFAAAVEACASTGSMVVPPVMGSAAFIMAQILEVHYFVVVLAAIIPACLYYLGVFLAVHFEAKKLGLSGMPKSEIPSVRKAILQSWPIAIPLMLLFYVLMRGYTMSGSIVLAIAVLAVTTQLNKDTRWDGRTLLRVFEGTAKTSVMAGGCIIVAGVLVGNFWVSGLGDTMSRLIQTASGGNLAVGLAITAVVCTVLGMGMAAPAVYLTVLVTGIPALIGLGLAPLPAHFFAFYWGMLAALTPPVCMAVFAAVPIAQSKLWPTAFLACKIGIVAYLVSFAFVFSPALLGQASFMNVVIALLPAVAGVFSVQIGISGYFLRVLNPVERTLLFLTGIAFWVPQLGVLIAAILVGALLVARVVLSRKQLLPGRQA